MKHLHFCVLLDTFRNTSLFLERLRPRYEDPGLYLLLPDSHRLGPKAREVHGAILKTIGGLMGNHVNFNVANEGDLDRLPSACRTLIWPVPYCPDDATFGRVVEFVRGGGALYLSGDVAYDPQRRRNRIERLADLGLEDMGPRPPFGEPAKGPPREIQQSGAGQGRVFYVPDPIELEDGPVVETLREFLAFAGARRIEVEPDDPRLHVFTVPLADGTATVVCNRTGEAQAVRLAGAELAVEKDLTGLVVMNDEDEVTAVECSGRCGAGGRPIASGDAHVMLAADDGRDVRQSTHLILFPITRGRLQIHTAAKWKSPVLEIGEYAGPSWKTLARVPLPVESQELTVEVDGDLVRSILILREAEATNPSEPRGSCPRSPAEKSKATNE